MSDVDQICVLKSISVKDVNTMVSPISLRPICSCLLKCLFNIHIGPFDTQRSPFICYFWRAVYVFQRPVVCINGVFWLQQSALVHTAQRGNSSKYKCRLVIRTLTIHAPKKNKTKNLECKTKTELTNERRLQRKRSKFNNQRRERKRTKWREHFSSACLRAVPSHSKNNNKTK